MPMWTVLTATGHIVAQSRLYEIALAYVAPGMVLLCNGEPVALELAA